MNIPKEKTLQIFPYPLTVYKKNKGMGDWLGTGRVQTRVRFIDHLRRLENLQGV